MDGMTIPAIAESLGVGVGTVHRALENSQFPNGKSEIVNARGQTRPATAYRATAEIDLIQTDKVPGKDRCQEFDTC